MNASSSMSQLAWASTGRSRYQASAGELKPKCHGKYSAFESSVVMLLLAISLLMVWRNHSGFSSCRPLNVFILAGDMAGLAAMRVLVLVLCWCCCVAQMPLLSPCGGVCSALVLLRALSSRGEARSNLVCHPLERVLSAATHHVTLPDAPCLPAAHLLTAWPVTPVPMAGEVVGFVGGAQFIDKFEIKFSHLWEIACNMMTDLLRVSVILQV
jgi:hypothetical protein